MSNAEESASKACIFKKPAKRGAARKRRHSSPEGEDSDDEDEPTVVRREKRPPKGGLYQKTNTKVMKKVEEEAQNSEEDENRLSRVTLTYQSERKVEPAGLSDMGATLTLETETEQDRDQRAVMERAQKMNQELKGKEEDNIYRGQNNYTKYIEGKETSQGSAASRKGPLRAPLYLRSTVRWDYQPDICKDYKETGYCGFGDSCKFLHDRGDYKSGWQLDWEYENNKYGKEDMKQFEVSSSDEEDLPFACYICREHFKNPVVSRCKHYFCESCALEQFKKSSRCAACGQQTGGIFNPAKEIVAKIKKAEEEGRAKIEGENPPD